MCYHKESTHWSYSYKNFRMIIRNKKITIRKRSENFKKTRINKTNQWMRVRA